jgi:hypothetical protein
MWVCGRFGLEPELLQAWQCKVLEAKMAKVTDAEKLVTEPAFKDEKATL